jgi:predicted transposase YdaD
MFGFLVGRQQGWLEGRHDGRLEGRQEGWKEGRLEGRLEGRRELLLLQLSQRFGLLSQPQLERLAKADIDQLDTWALHVRDAYSLEGLLARGAREHESPGC